MVRRFLIYGAAGITLEITWTGFTSFMAGDITFTGHSSIIMFPIYGMAVFLEPLFSQLKETAVFIRGIIYMSLIFAVEYFTGYFLTLCGICPWSYINTALNINGLIRLDYAPLWFIVGLFFEHIFRRLSYFI